MIDTARLILRPAASDDLVWLQRAINTAAVMRHLGGVRTDEQIAQSLAGDVEAFDRPDGHQRWTALRKSGGERVARVGLFHLLSEAAPAAIRGQREIGWMVPEAHWGNGYASEAAGAVLDWAFGTLGLPQVISQTSDSNVASTGMMRHLGFARRAEYDYVDPDYPAEDNPTTVWSLTAADWSRRRG